MSIYNAIANSGQNVGQGITNYFATKHQLSREKEADDMARQQNAFAIQDRQFQYKQQLLKEAAIIRTQGGDPIAHLRANAPKYGITDPVDESVLPLIDGIAAQMGQQGEKFALNPMYFEGPDGNLVAGQLRQSGGVSLIQTPEGYRPVPSNVMRSDVGDQIVYRDSRTGAVLGTDTKGLPPQDTPETRGAVAETVKGVESSFDKRSAFPKVRNSIKAEQDKTVLVENKIDEALAIIDKYKGWATGGGSFLKYVPTTEARKLSTILDTIKANVAFGELQTMRQNSPTGGALGSVSDSENKRLESVQGSLDQGLEAQDLASNLRTIKQFRRQAYTNLESAFMQDFGEFLDVKVNNSVTDPKGDGGWKDVGGGVKIRRVQ